MCVEECSVEVKLKCNYLIAKSAKSIAHVAPAGERAWIGVIYYYHHLPVEEEEVHWVSRE